MTSRDRFLRSFRGGTLDRFLRYDHGPWPSTRERWLGEGYPSDVRFDRYFDMDPLVKLPIQSGYVASPYCPAFTEKILEESAGCRTFVDGDGITKKVFVQHGDTSMPQFLKFPVTDRADWAVLRHRLNPADAPNRVGDAAALRAVAGDPSVPSLMHMCGAFGHPRNLFGDENLSYLMYDDPALLEEILENWRDLYTELIRHVTGIVRVDAILIWEDMCYKSGPLISPEAVRRFMLPRYREVIAVARSCGIEAIIVDTDGDCLKLIPLFMEAGVDSLMPFEVQAGMDVVAIGRQYPELAIMGGLDKRALAGSFRDIEREVDRVLPHFLSRGRFVPCLDHTVPPNVSLEKFRYYLDYVRKYE